MGKKPPNYLKIPKNIENNPKWIKKDMEIEFGTYLRFYGSKEAIFVQLLLFWPKFGPKNSHKMSPKTLNDLKISKTSKMTLS